MANQNRDEAEKKHKRIRSDIFQMMKNSFEGKPHVNYISKRWFS